MRYALGFALVLCVVLAENIKDIEKNINVNKAKIQEKTKQQKQISSRLSELGNTINERKAQIAKIQNQINLLQKNIKQNQSQNQSQTKKLNDLKQAYNVLESQKSRIQLYIANLIANDLAFSLVLDKQSVVSPDDMILEDVFNVLTQQSQEKILTLNNQQSQVTEQMNKISSNISEIISLIDTQESKKQQLQKMINTQKVLSEKLQSEINDYNKKFAQIAREREELDSILRNLNITKANKQKEIQARLEAQKKARQAQAAQQSQDKAKTQANNKIDTPQVTNGYQNVSVVKYTGSKTIAPLDHYTVEQNFGPYYDSVYNLKVFNESVTLLSKNPDAVVYSIFDGEVVYAKEVSMLKKVIVIKHQNEMHSIYSQLDKIAPTIKPGFVVKKGYTIGRISQRLGLAVTQKDKHIDPLEIISKSK